jgi:hypothetical protein
MPKHTHANTHTHTHSSFLSIHEETVMGFPVLAEKLANLRHMQRKLT